MQDDYITQSDWEERKFCCSLSFLELLPFFHRSPSNIHNNKEEKKHTHINFKQPLLKTITHVFLPDEYVYVTGWLLSSAQLPRTRAIKLMAWNRAQKTRVFSMTHALGGGMHSSSSKKGFLCFKNKRLFPTALSYAAAVCGKLCKWKRAVWPGNQEMVFKGQFQGLPGQSSG